MNVDRPVTRLAIPGFGARRPTDEAPVRTRLKCTGWMRPNVRANVVSFIGEFVGTCMFLFFAFAGTQVALTAGSDAVDIARLLYISLAFGMSLLVTAWTFFYITGGLFNPAVTVAMCLIGAVPWIRGILDFISQLAGGIAAAGLVSALFPGPMNVETVLSPGVSVARGLFIESFSTAQLVFTIIMLAAEKHKSTPIAPVGIGLALFISELSAVYFTGGSLNPARSLGPAVINARFSGHHWIYWVGPLFGSLLAVAFYKLIKALEYEVGNPNADETIRKVFKTDGDERYDGACSMYRIQPLGAYLERRLSSTSHV